MRTLSLRTQPLSKDTSAKCFVGRILAKTSCSYSTTRYIPASTHEQGSPSPASQAVSSSAFATPPQPQICARVHRQQLLLREVVLRSQPYGQEKLSTRLRLEHLTVINVLDDQPMTSLAPGLTGNLGALDPPPTPGFRAQSNSQDDLPGSTTETNPTNMICMHRSKRLAPHRTPPLYSVHYIVHESLT